MKPHCDTEFSLVSLFGILLLLASSPMLAATQIASQLPASTRISAVGGGNSYDPIVSSGGRFVLFAGTSDNLVTAPGGLAFLEAVPAHMNVFMRDRLTGTTVLVSINTTGMEGGNGDSVPCAISTNGQFAFFQSAASNLVAGDTNGASDIFVRDTVNNITTLVSVATNGTVGNGASHEAVITPEGRYVAFVSAASNLVARDTNGIPDVFVRDLQLGITTLASVGSVGAQNINITAASGTTLTVGSTSESPLISANGRYVAFYSTAIGLVAGVTNGGELYVRDLVQGSTVWVSANAHSINPSAVSANYAMSTNGQLIAYQTTGGSPSGMVFRYNMATGDCDDISTNGALVTSLDLESRRIDISADGRFVAFTLTNTAGGISIQLWDSQSGAASLISGGTSNALSDFPRVDQTGRYVAFTSDDASLTTNSDGAIHVYLRDTATAAVQLADVGANGATPISTIMSPFHLGADGSVVVFDCPDGAMSINRNKFDAFLRDFGSNTTEIISTPAPTLPSATPLNSSELASSSVSSNGQYVAFTSDSDGIVSGDTNGFPDVFVHDFSSGSNTLVSVSLYGANSGNGNSWGPAISADGRYVAFVSSATNLVANDTNNATDIFLRDMQTGSTMLVSQDAGGVGEGNGNSSAPQISADGRHVLFFSLATNLTTNNGITGTNAFWRDVQAGVTYALTGSAGNSLSTVGAAVMTPDGSNVLFALGTQLAGEGGNEAFQVFLWNAQSHTATNLATLSSPVIDAAISADAHGAAFETQTNCYAANLVANSNWVLAAVGPTSHTHSQLSSDARFLAYLAKDSTGTNQVYLYDFQNATSNLVSQAYNSTIGGNGACDSVAISADGSFVAYRSAATNLVPGDINGVPDIFLYDRLSGGTTLISLSEYGAWSANGRSTTPVFSGDGQTLFFESWASDLVAGDFNESSDVFAVSLATNGSESTTNAPQPLNFTAIIPGIANGQFTTNQPLTLTWPSLIGVGYQVQFKNSLTDPEWQPVGGPATVVGNQGSAVDFTPAVAQRFYRIVSF
jgi:Tol biopolymer transport system component